jgi:diguanylate cyclase (GGDEF)-like protein
MAILMVDVDHFKKVNDQFGHLVGDHVLEAVADCLQRNIRKADIAGRYGGEEFVLLLPETKEASAIALAERLREEISTLDVCHEGISIPVTISIGVAQKTKECASLDTLLLYSDEALYAAKSAGRNSVCSWEMIKTNKSIA